MWNRKKKQGIEENQEKLRYRKIRTHHAILLSLLINKVNHLAQCIRHRLFIRASKNTSPLYFALTRDWSKTQFRCKKYMKRAKKDLNCMLYILYPQTIYYSHHYIMLMPCRQTIYKCTRVSLVYNEKLHFHLSFSEFTHIYICMQKTI